MAALEDTVRRYVQSWNATDATERRALVEAVFTPNAVYVDPLVTVTGWDAIDHTIGAVQQQFPGLRFTLADGVDAHHDQVRFRWQLGAPEAEEPLVVGFDVAVAADGRFDRVYGFLDKVPAA
jgi:SnoaL-like domain